MNVLVLAPHTDDEALGCGATIAKHVQMGDTVHTIAFSTCGRDDLSQEATAASLVLGSSIDILTFPVRRFDEHRQAILDRLISARELHKPDRVYLPCSTDVHQDHEVIHQEGMRAFKHCTVLGYELPWNCRTFTASAFVRVAQDDVTTKAEAVACYKSQAHRAYITPEAIAAQASFRGLQAGSQFAETFEVLRWIS